MSSPPPANIVRVEKLFHSSNLMHKMSCNSNVIYFSSVDLLALRAGEGYTVQCHIKTQLKTTVLILFYAVIRYYVSFNYCENDGNKENALVYTIMQQCIRYSLGYER